MRGEGVIRVKGKGGLVRVRLTHKMSYARIVMVLRVLYVDIALTAVMWWMLVMSA